MAQSEARAWWADVQYLREDFERRDAARRRVSRLPVDEPFAPGDAFDEDDAFDGGGAFSAAPAVDPVDPADELAVRRAAREDRRPPSAERRTIEIRGYAVPAPSVPRLVEVDRRRPPRRPAERVGQRPDRVAAWALVMALVLILVAVGSADAAVAAGL